MIFISARLEIDPVHIEAYIEQARQVVGPTLKEKGCNRYSFARDICEANVLWISEEWETEHDLVTHLSTDHIRNFLASTAELGLRSMDAQKYQVSSAGPMVAPES